jgi:hypothetical protein
MRRQVHSWTDSFQERFQFPAARLRRETRSGFLSRARVCFPGSHPLESGKPGHRIAWLKNGENRKAFGDKMWSKARFARPVKRARLPKDPHIRNTPPAWSLFINDAAVDRMCSSMREFGFKIPVLARSNDSGIPVILCDEWTEAQVKAFRLLVNRSVTWVAWDDELLAHERLIRGTPPRLVPLMSGASKSYTLPFGGGVVSRSCGLKLSGPRARCPRP